MSEQPTTLTTSANRPAPEQVAPHEKEPLFPIAKSWKIASGVAGVMVLLALIGVALTSNNSSAASAYWVSLVPIYGMLCVATAWARARVGERFNRALVARQVFHWLGVAVALVLDFVIRGTGQETSNVAGLNALLLLALGSYLAGIHLDWFFVPVGVLLCLAAILVSKAEQYLWLTLIACVLGFAALFVVRWLLVKAQARKAATGAVTGPQPAGS